MDNFNILAIDPGSNFLGASIFTLNSNTLEIVNIETVSINLTTIINNNPLYNNLSLRLQRLQSIIKNILEYYDPRIVTVESGFINLFRPGAVIPIAQSIAIIENTVLNYSPFIKMFSVPPSIIKMNVNASFKAKKDEMLVRVSEIKEITKFVNPYSLTEHVVDSIAINYTMLNTLRSDGVHLLLTI